MTMVVFAFSKIQPLFQSNNRVTKKGETRDNQEQPTEYKPIFYNGYSPNGYI